MNKLVGQVLSDRYLIQALLGKQKGRRTFLAKDTTTQQQVVIKVILFSPDFTWQDLKLFEREAETLQAIGHPAIPEYLTSFEVDIAGGKGFALVQTYIDAKSLQAWVDGGRTFSEAELQAIAHALLGILSYLHHRHPPIIHRDIKPSNILLQASKDNDDFTIFLVDFGSVQTARTNGTMTVVGTYGYMPPEQFGGRTVPASDLYSLGATLIYLATGQHPADLTQDNMQIDFESTSNLSNAFTNWIRRLTYPDMARRIRTVETAQQTLTRLQHQASAPPPPPTITTAPAILQRSHEATPQAPALPLAPILADFKISTTADSLEIRCLSARIKEYSAATERNQKLATKATTPFALSALAFAGFWIALGLAILSDVSGLVIFMLIAIVAFGFYYPVLSSKASRRTKETLLRFSSLESGRTRLKTTTVPIPSPFQQPPALRSAAIGSSEEPPALRSSTPSLSGIEVRSLSVNAHFATEPHLVIALSPPDALSLSQIEISGTQREIQWLRDHLVQWGQAPIH
ncbi:MAG: serine/threonine protein kinase [Phormidesmis sp.]